MPTVTAIIPTYNRASLLHRAIDSVLGQTHPLHEVIVVDDGSLDETRQVVEKYGARVRYVRRENGGLAAARNTGVAHATSEWVAFLDDDDEWYADKIERQVVTITAKPEADICYSGLILRGPAGQEVFRRATSPDLIWPTIRLRNPFSPCTVMMRRSLFNEIGGFDEQLRCVEDWEFHVRAVVGRQLAMVDAPLTLVHETPHTMSRHFANMLAAELSIVEKLLVGLTGPSRCVWRWRILSRMYDRAAVSARAAGVSPWPWLSRSLLYWPSPDIAPYRYRTAILELFAAIRGSRRVVVSTKHNPA
jgi:glycosyltransferase involved in cell wall biosynthesis